MLSSAWRQIGLPQVVYPYGNLVLSPPCIGRDADIESSISPAMGARQLAVNIDLCFLEHAVEL